ncbi:MAG: hypothetical protein HWD85_02230 [Flavobacteriaceae bacterium]|nr:hypothetical protein [Flavobacteriaceae bacterium]
MKKRVYQIDLFRFFAAFFVVVFHYTFAAFNAKEKTLFIDYQEFEFFSKYGYLGVDLFFMISGFVILKIINSVFILKFSSYFIAGMLLYRIYTEGIKAKYIIGVLFCLALSLYYAINRITYLESYYSSNFSYIIISGIVFTFYLLMYLVSVNKLNFLNKEFFLKLGILTYSLYLVHQVVGIIMLNSLKDYMDKNLLLLLIITLMFLVSYLVNLLVEKPLSKKMKLKLDIIIKNKL